MHSILATLSDAELTSLMHALELQRKHLETQRLTLEPISDDAADWANCKAAFITLQHKLGVEV